MHSKLDEVETGESQSTGIQSVEIGMAILDAFVESSSAMSLKQVSLATNMAPSKVHRYLASFVRSGMLVQVATNGLYDLGPKARRLGLAAMGRLDAFSVATNGLLKLRDLTGHTVCMTVWGQGGPIMVRWESGREPLIVNLRIGSSIPLLDTSIGHTFLAHLPKSITQPALALQQQLAGAETERKFPSDEELERIRANRSIYTMSALIEGVDAIAAPVFEGPDRLFSVITLAAPHRSLKGSQLGRIRQQVEAIAREVSAELGYREA
ncbi:IclR family transcriptional regulator [Novosphingobium sp.]|uniref:IclR family transcriptional regulator n=1 Tax=Novosphingobium sp. TaxID=1874826 RepID=UPI003BAB86D0